MILGVGFHVWGPFDTSFVESHFPLLGSSAIAVPRGAKMAGSSLVEVCDFCFPRVPSGRSSLATSLGLRRLSFWEDSVCVTFVASVSWEPLFQSCTDAWQNCCFIGRFAPPIQMHGFVPSIADASVSLPGSRLESSGFHSIFSFAGREISSPRG